MTGEALSSAETSLAFALACIQDRACIPLGNLCGEETYLLTAHYA